MQRKKAISFSTTHIILSSFLLVIVIGTLLLWLPISHAEGQYVSFIDALVTATTSVCVTGLVTLTTFSTWSIFGQVVILLLIQIGGLGFITIAAGILISLHKKMNMKSRMLIQDAFNLNSLSGIVKFTRNVIRGTFIVEGIGALMYMTVFVPEYGAKGIWISVFTSISAFCNAGIDIIASDSLCGYVTNPIINFTTCFLIIAGGIGFVVWWDVVNALKKIKQKGIRAFREFSLHSKIALSATAVLIVSGWVLFFVFEYNNPLTIADFSLGDKLMASLFQSVTTRTAGFATIPQENFSNASSIISLLMMFIGGSPAGTAGGIKTVTVAVVFASAFATIRHHKDVTLFGRTVTKEAIGKAASVMCMSFVIMFISTVLLAAVTEADMLSVIYETVSATATVGLTRNLTGSLDMWGKLIIIVTMYLGRVGPISLAVAFSTQKEKQNIIKCPAEDISVG